MNVSIVAHNVEETKISHSSYRGEFDVHRSRIATIGTIEMSVDLVCAIFEKRKRLFVEILDLQQLKISPEFQS